MAFAAYMYFVNLFSIMELVLQDTNLEEEP